MSRIIKAQQSNEVSPFDFHEIGGDSPSKGPDGGASEESRESAEEAEGDPRIPPEVLAELEETIRVRTLEAERRAQELEKEAYEKAYAQGLKEGTEYGRKSMEVTRKQLERAIRGFEGIRERILEDHRQWLVESALALAKLVVGRELELHSAPLLALVEEALARAREHHSLTLHLHPKDLRLIQEETSWEALKEKVEKTFVLRSDEHLERGGFRLESDLQLIEGNLNDRFRELEEQLRGRDASDR